MNSDLDPKHSFCESSGVYMPKSQITYTISLTHFKAIFIIIFLKKINKKRFHISLIHREIYTAVIFNF